MEKISFISAMSIGLLSISLAAASPSDAVGQIHQNATQVLSVLKGDDTDGARHKTEAYALSCFDFQCMAAPAIGNPWRQATGMQKQALTREFRTLLIRTYSDTMLQFKSAKVNVEDNPVVNKGGKEIVVHVEVSNSGERPVSMDFSTYQSGSHYRVYNMAVEGVSLVTVYREQFSETVKNKGVNGLIDELETKNSGEVSKS